MRLSLKKACCEPANSEARGGHRLVFQKDIRVNGQTGNVESPGPWGDLLGDRPRYVSVRTF